MCFHARHFCGADCRKRPNWLVILKAARHMGKERNLGVERDWMAQLGRCGRRRLRRPEHLINVMLQLIKLRRTCGLRGGRDGMRVMINGFLHGHAIGVRVLGHSLWMLVVLMLVVLLLIVNVRGESHPRILGLTNRRLG